MRPGELIPPRCRFHGSAGCRARRCLLQRHRSVRLSSPDAERRRGVIDGTAFAATRKASGGAPELNARMDESGLCASARPSSAPRRPAGAWRALDVATGAIRQYAPARRDRTRPQDMPRRSNAAGPQSVRGWMTRPNLRETKGGQRMRLPPADRWGVGAFQAQRGITRLPAKRSGSIPRPVRAMVAARLITRRTEYWADQSSSGAHGETHPRRWSDDSRANADAADRLHLPEGGSFDPLSFVLT
jgi:hypothetical protein